jgi:ABC-type sugar transport system ATPase subunit
VASIHFDGVGKVFSEGTVALADLDLDVPDGEFMVLVGPSGSGKSTALRIVAGLEDATSGEVRIGDRVVNDVEPKDRDIAMVFQSYALYPHMTVADNLSFPLRMHHEPKARIAESVGATAGRLEIAGLLDRRPRQLSGGQRQRVALGRAIVRDPVAFLMDEPLSNLDAKLRVEMRAYVRHLHEHLEKTILYVTHDQVEAMTMGERVAVMRDGRLEQVDAPQTLYDRPTSLFVASFIGSPAMNLLPGRVIAPGQVETAGGRLEFDAAKFPAEAGLHVEVGIRPEDLGLSANGTGALAFAKDFAEELGATRLFHGTVGGAAVVVALSGPAAAGDSLSLNVAPESVHLFDPASGSSLRQ